MFGAANGNLRRSLSSGDGWGVEQHFASEFIMLIFLCGARRNLFGVKHELDGTAGDNNDIGEVLDDDH